MPVPLGNDRRIQAWRYNVNVTAHPSAAASSVRNQRAVTADPPASPRVEPGGPVWPVAELQPAQGDWSVEAYLKLTDSTNRLIEYIDGSVEFLPMPTDPHQCIVKFLFLRLNGMIDRDGLGTLQFAPLRVQVSPTRFREPDLLFVRKEHEARLRGRRFWTGADLVMEVVSPDNPDRDWVEKAADYAAAGIAEYWIVDPQQQRVRILTLEPSAAEYAVHRDAGPGETVGSVLLPGFEVEVGPCLAAGE